MFLVSPASKVERKWAVDLLQLLAPAQECPVAQYVPHIPRTMSLLERRQVSQVPLASHSSTRSLAALLARVGGWKVL